MAVCRGFAEKTRWGSWGGPRRDLRRIAQLDSLGDAVQQPDGKIVVVGSFYERARDTIGMLAFRLRADGRLDRTFAPKRRR